MDKNSEKQPTPSGPGTNPDVYPEDGAINPSAPSVGTEGWGTTSDERRVLTRQEPEDTRAGQQKGNLGDNQTEVSQRASEKTNTAEGGATRHRKSA
jgi:hypothetical protein